MGFFFRNMLDGIPVFNNFSCFIKSEEIHGYIFVIIRPGLMGMQGNHITFGHTSYEFDGLVRVFCGHSIKVIDAAHHLAEVTALFPKTKSTTIDFVMPAWRLGKYKVLNLANGIRYFSVTDAKGHDIVAKKVDKNTWRVNLDKPSKLAVSYQLYANQLADRARHIDDTHAYLDGASSFIYSPVPLSIAAIWKLLFY